MGQCFSSVSAGTAVTYGTSAGASANLIPGIAGEMSWPKRSVMQSLGAIRGTHALHAPFAGLIWPESSHKP